MGGKEALELIENARAHGDRFLIAVDAEGFHFRETLCVIHRSECGEVHYHTKPVLSDSRFTDAIIKGCDALANNHLQPTPERG